MGFKALQFLIGAFILIVCTSKAFAMVLSDQLLSNGQFASQGAVVLEDVPDSLAWTQNPSHLANQSGTQFSGATYLVAPDLNPKPIEKSALGSQVLGLSSRGLSGSVGVALAMPLGQNVWVDTGSRESSSLFSLSRMSAFSLGLGWARNFQDGWAVGFQIPVLFRSNTVTDIYLVEDSPWARARTGVKPYLGWHFGFKKNWLQTDTSLAVSYREEQASKIEFSVEGAVDFATLTLPLDAAGFSEILFEPRRLDLQMQQKISSHLLVGLFLRWSNWKSAPPLGLVIDSKVPEMSTNPSEIEWRDQWEISTGLSYKMNDWSALASYRYRSKAVISSNDYWDYNEHVLGAGARFETIAKELWLSLAIRLHSQVGDGRLWSTLLGLDWVL